MKKTFVMLSAICVFALAAQAHKPTTISAPQTTDQESRKGGEGKHETPEQRAQQSVDRLDKIVGLSPAQKTQVHDLAIARVNAVDAIRAKYKGQPDKKEAAKAEIQETIKQYRSNVKKLLTPDQLKKLSEYHKANKGKAHEEIPTAND